MTTSGAYEEVALNPNRAEAKCRAAKAVSAVLSTKKRLGLSDGEYIRLLQAVGVSGEQD